MWTCLQVKHQTFNEIFLMRSCSGIGYWVLPFLVHARAEHVIACEWNPASVSALRHNLDQMKLSDRCTVLQGDNREVCPSSVADRVNLGLIPQSEISWRTACEALKDEGGVLHVHGNVEVGRDESKRVKLDTWAESVRCSIQTILAEVKEREFSTQVIHVECVKSYGPRVYHAVADIQCRL